VTHEARPCRCGRRRLVIRIGASGDRSGLRAIATDSRPAPLNRALGIHGGLLGRCAARGSCRCLRSGNRGSAAAGWREVYAAVAYLGIRISTPDGIREGNFDVPLLTGFGIGRHIEVQSIPLPDPFERGLQRRGVVNRHHVAA